MEELPTPGICMSTGRFVMGGARGRRDRGDEIAAAGFGASGTFATGAGGNAGAMGEAGAAGFGASGSFATGAGGNAGTIGEAGFTAVFAGAVTVASR